MGELTAGQQEVSERALDEEMKADMLAQRLQESEQEQVAMLAALEHEKAVQKQTRSFLNRN